MVIDEMKVQSEKEKIFPTFLCLPVPLIEILAVVQNVESCTSLDCLSLVISTSV